MEESFENYLRHHVLLLSRVQLFVTPWTIGCLGPLCGDSPGKNTGVGCHALLQGIFPTQGSNPGLLHCRQILYQLSHEGSPRVLEWVAYPIFYCIHLICLFSAFMGGLQSCLASFNHLFFSWPQPTSFLIYLLQSSMNSCICLQANSL